MASYKPAYRARVYAERDLVTGAETTVLTPAAGAPHAEAFQVASVAGIPGYKPILSRQMVGRRSTVDPLEKSIDTGQLVLRLLDKRTGTGNDARWVTAFVGDGKGGNRLPGRRVEVDENLAFDPATPEVGWTRFATVRIGNPRLDGRLWVELPGLELTNDLDADVFVGAPHANAAGYAHQAQLLPLGLRKLFGDFPTVAALSGKVMTAVTTGGVTYTTVQLTERDPKRRTLPRVAMEARAAREVRVTITRTSDGVSRTWKAAFNPIGLGVERVLGFTENGEISPFALNDVVTIELQAPTREASEALPVLVNDVHPVTYLKHLLSGYFGLLDKNGAPSWSIPTDSGQPGSTFDALEQDQTLPKMRFIHRERAKMNEHAEADVLAPCNLAWNFDEFGRVRLVDLRRKSVTAPAWTITNAALVGSAGAPTWETMRDQAVTSVLAKFYGDRLITDREIPAPNSQLPGGVDGWEAELPPGEFPDLPTVLIEQVDERPVLLLGAEDRVVDVKAKQFKLEAPGLRYRTAVYHENGRVKTPEEQRSGEALQAAHARYLEGAASDLRGPFGTGPSYAELICRRSDPQVSAAKVGTYGVLDVDELPDPATNARGGQRLALVIGREEDGPRVRLTVLDAGANATALPPTLGAVAAAADDPRHTIVVPVTLNAAGEMVVLEVALTDPSVAVRPAEGSELWRGATLVRASGTARIAGLTARLRAWVRGRTAAPSGGGYKLPSALAYPSAPGYIDLTAPPAPSGLVVTQNGARATVTFTAGDAALPVDVLLVIGAAPATWPESAVRETLIPGDLSAEIDGIVAGTTYTIGLRTRDPEGGVSTVTTSTFVGGAALQLAAPETPTGWSSGRFGRRYGLAVKAVEFPSTTEFREALETAVGSGVYGAWVTVADRESVAGDWTICILAAPADGLRRKLSARHTRGTDTPSAWTADVVVQPSTWVSLPAFVLPAIDFLQPDGKPKRNYPWSDGEFAWRASSTDGLTGSSGVKDSRAAVINAHFRYGVDGAGGVIESTTQKFTHGDVLDANRRIARVETTAQIAGRTASTIVDEARKGHGKRGANLVVNGDIETGDTFNLSGSTVPEIAQVTDAPTGKYVAQRTGTGGVFLTQEMIPVDPARPYLTALRARHASGLGPPRFYAGVVPYDSMLRVISLQNYYSPGNVKPALAAAAGVGNTVVTLSSVTGLFDRGYLCFGAAADDSDVPNFNVYKIAAGGINAATNQVTLTTALTAAYALNSLVRYTESGGSYLYSAASNALLSAAWQEFSGVVEGVAGITEASAFKFRPGTRYVRWHILPNYSGGDATTVAQYDDWRIEPLDFVQKAPHVIDGKEGRRRTDTFYAADSKLLAAVKDSRDAILNAHFRFGVDGPSGIVETTLQKFVDGNYLDTNRRPNRLQYATGARTGDELHDSYNRAVGTIQDSTGLLQPGAKDSRSAVLNAHFRSNVDDATAVVETVTHKFTHSEYLDATRRPFALWDGAAATSIGSTTINEGRRRALGGFTGETGQLVSTAVDSRAATINTHFRYGVDSAYGVTEPLDRRFVHGDAIDSNRRIARVERSAKLGTVDLQVDKLASNLQGAQCVANPDYATDLAGYAVYDNAASGRISLARFADVAVPNGTGFYMGVTVAAGAVQPSPGMGGFYLGIGPDSGTHRPNTYHRGAEIIWRIMALLPSGYALGYATNGIGTGSAIEELSNPIGDGSTWKMYSWRVKVGTAGTLSTTGFFYLVGPATTGGLGWSVAVVDGIDINLPPTVYGGVQMRHADTGAKAGDDGIFHGRSGATDSRSAVLNGHFRHGVDGPTGIVETATQKFTHGDFLDASRKPNRIALVGGGTRTGDELGDSYNRAIGTIQDSTGLLQTGAKDSRSAVLNTHFRASVDSLDAMVDGATYKRVDSVVSGKIGDGSINTAANFAKVGGVVGGTTISGGGTITWSDTGALSWTQRFISIPDPLSVSGFFDFGPVSGLAIAGWQGLWYRVNIGGTSAHANHALDATGTGYFVESYTTYVAPASASGKKDYLIAMRNGDTNNLHLWDGRVIPAGGNSIQLGTAQVSKIPSFAGDSRAAALNAHFRHGVDGPSGIVETASQKFIDGAYLDTSRRPTQLVRAAGDSIITAEMLVGHLDSDPQNLVKNGSGQSSPLTGGAGFWSYGGGAAATVQADGSPPLGDRSIKFDHGAVLNYSYAFQDIFYPAPQVGDVFEISCRVRSEGTSGTGTLGAIVTSTEFAGCVEQLARTGASVYPTTYGEALHAIGSGAAAWLPYRSVMRVKAAHTNLRVYIVFGMGGNTTGQMWVRDIVVRKLDPDIPLGGARGRRGLNDGGEVTQHLPTGIGSSDGVAPRAISKGRVSGNARNGESITFPVAFQNAPIVIIRGGINYEPRSKWGATGSGSEVLAPTAVAQYDDARAVSLSASGFEMRARLRQKGSSSARSHPWPASNNLNTAGALMDRNLDFAPASDDTYYARFSVSVTAYEAVNGQLNRVTIVVALDVNDGSGPLERATATFTASTKSSQSTFFSGHEVLSATVPGLDGTDDVRLRIKSVEFLGDGGGEFSVHGFDGVGDPAPGVTYTTSSGDQFASKTPDAEDRVEWEAFYVG